MDSAHREVLVGAKLEKLHSTDESSRRRAPVTRASLLFLQYRERIRVAVIKTIFIPLACSAAHIVSMEALRLEQDGAERQLDSAIDMGWQLIQPGTAIGLGPYTGLVFVLRKVELPLPMQFQAIDRAREAFNRNFNGAGS